MLMGPHQPHFMGFMAVATALNSAIQNMPSSREVLTDSTALQGKLYKGSSLISPECLGQCLALRKCSLTNC